MHLSPCADTTVAESRIAYPSYKSLDHFIDVGQLKSLDQYLTDKIREHIASGAKDLFLNEHRLDPATPHEPGRPKESITKLARLGQSLLNLIAKAVDDNVNLRMAVEVPRD